MKKIWNFLKGHIQQDFNYRHYFLVGAFLAGCLYFNYKFDLYDNFLRYGEGSIKFLYYFIFYAIAYYFSVLSYVIFYKKSDFIRDKKFWIKSLFVILILTLDSSLPYLYIFIEKNFNGMIQFWVYKVLNNLCSVGTVLIPLLIFHYLYDRKENHWYGLQAKRFDAKPYFLILLIVVPIIVIASFHESFLLQYPMYQTTEAHKYLHVPEWVTVLIYEIAYGFDFVSVELIFRGFLVIGMMTFMGRGAVLAMASVYCFLHFGKPPGEAISSIFGGYILGVIAYETKSIWGGIIVHLGVAWTMEISAFMQKLH